MSNQGAKGVKGPVFPNNGYPGYCASCNSTPTGAHGCGGLHTGTKPYPLNEHFSDNGAEMDFYFHSPFPDNRMMVNGNVKSVALHILETAIERSQRLNTLHKSYQWEPPTHITWGPFSFNTSSLHAEIIVSSWGHPYSVEEMNVLNEILDELNKLLKMKAFW